MNGFDLFREGRVREAIEAYTTELALKASPTTFANRALAHMSIGDYSSAMSDSAAADALQRQLTGETTDGYLQQSAVAMWLSGDHANACNAFSRIVGGLERNEFAFSDRAGGVGSGLLLWYSSIAIGDEARLSQAQHFLRSKIEAGLSTFWPGPIAEYALGLLDYPALMKAAQAQQRLALRRGCQAAFYAAIRARSAGDTALAAHLIRLAVEYGEDSAIELEYYLALEELKREAVSRA